ncbi:XdhC family protein [Actibacterium mucosum]|uniref:XdhC family protein n=1 Tax=Actibacterium mucosum TaxID=1087332 RepID=UPI00068A82BC|nr:XdhC family protein [Actibacterium mucosum]
MSIAEHDQIIEAALAMVDAGQPVALATVLETWGSAPRPVGAQLAISGDAAMVGSVSGGCVEGAVVAEALDLLETGECRVLEFGVSDDDAFAVGLACGGRIKVLVEPIGVGQGPSSDLLRDLAAARAARRPAAYVVNMSTWDRKIAALDDPQIAEAALAEKSRLDGELFIGLHMPPLRLAIIGAVHIAQALSDMAALAGYDVTVIDPRDSFGSTARFPGHTVVNDWPDEALAAHGLDARTAVVTLTHDPKLDNPAIQAALGADIFYLGCLGSTRTHGKRVAFLQQQGFSKAQIARIHGPVGLNIGSKTPAEIAVSILGQMTERLRRPETRP